jgi:uncharacterized protein YidB (DUF937 family)
MGLLDELLGGMMGGTTDTRSPMGAQAQGQNPLLMLALQLLQQNGGLEGILGRFQQAGYGQQAQSWVGTGQNLPIDPNVLTQIFGGDRMGQFGQQFGMSTDEASGGLADVLPQVIDRMTPQGRVEPGNNDLVSEALAILQRGRGG